MYTSIINYLERTTELYPEKIAVSDGNGGLSFRELEKQAKCFATDIIDSLGEERNVPVAVYMEKSRRTVIADIGISYSSCFFMNLDIKTPGDRIQAILQHVEPMIVVVDTKS